jgi:hypothetical protein
LSYHTVRRDETIAIAAQSLDADLGFGKGMPVDYTVTAKAVLYRQSGAERAWRQAARIR